jgi:hypothetical protein
MDTSNSDIRPSLPVEINKPKIFVPNACTKIDV